MLKQRLGNLLRSFYSRKVKTSFEKSLLKATYHKDSDPPKDKHVIVVIAALDNRDPQFPPKIALQLVLQRLLERSWNTVLKTEIILHRAIHSSLGLAREILNGVEIRLPCFGSGTPSPSSYGELAEEYLRYIQIAASTNHSHILGRESQSLVLDKMTNFELIDEFHILVDYTKSLITLKEYYERAFQDRPSGLVKDVGWNILKDARKLHTTLVNITKKIISGAPKFNQWNRDVLTGALDKYSLVIQDFFSIFDLTRGIDRARSQGLDDSLLSFHTLGLDKTLDESQREEVGLDHPEARMFSSENVAQQQDADQELSGVRPVSENPRKTDCNPIFLHFHDQVESTPKVVDLIEFTPR